MNRTAVIALTVLALGLAGCSSAPAGAEPKLTPTADIDANPAPTVTVTAEPVVTEVTPQSCLDALDIAAEAMVIMSEVQGLFSPALEAAAAWDAPALDEVSGQIAGLNTDLTTKTPALSQAVTACRGAAK